MIDYEAESAVYEQIAADIRKRIEAGEWAPRRRLPSVTHLEQHYGVARNTILQALSLLRDLGIIYTIKNRGSFVKLGADDVSLIVPESGVRIIARMPTEDEREELGMTDGIPLLVVDRDGQVDIYPADKAEVRGPDVG